MTLCSSCGTPFNEWNEETYDEIVLPEEPEIRPELTVTKIPPQMEKQLLEKVSDEIDMELKPIALMISPEKGQEPQIKISEDMLPADYDGLASIKRLVWDPYNPRDEEPTDELVESVRKTGFARAIIVRPTANGKFYVTDGWQRAQAAVRVGWKQVPYKLYETAPEALEETKREDIKREWTKYQRIKYYRNFYHACREEDMDHQSAFQRIVNKDPAGEQSVLRYLRITNPRLLPPIVQSLLKEPKNRTIEEWNHLEKIYYPIRRIRRTLTIGQADAIAIYLRNFTTEQKVRVAIGVLGLTYAEAIHKIRIVSKYPEEDPIEIIQQLDTGAGIDEILDVGTLVVNLKLKRDLLEYCTMRRINLKDFLIELLTEWWIMEKIKKLPELEAIELKIAS